MRMKISWRVGLLALLLLAFFLRVYRLTEIPPGLYYDEAAHGLDALGVWEGRLFVFFPTANGHEPLFTYLVAAFVRVLEHSLWAVRLPAAMLGVLAVAATFALGRRLLGPWPALFAAGVIAVTFWTLSLSRIGYRANALPVLLPLWLLSFWHCRDRRDLAPYLLAGGLLALTQYTYTAARFIPFLALVLAWDWRQHLDRRGLLGGGFVAAILVLPLGLAILSDPDAGTERIRDAWLFGRSEPWRLLWQQILDHVAMFGVRGDPLWIHNWPLRSPVAWPLALLFWGMVVFGWRQPATRTLLWTGLILIWPGVLAVSNNPASPDHLRVIELAAPTFLLAGGALGWLSQRSGKPWLIGGLALVLWLYDGGQSWLDYQRWGQARETYEQFDADMTRIARKVVEDPETMFILPLSADWREFEPGHHWTIDYLAHGSNNYYAATVPFDPPALDYEQVALVKWLAGMHLSADPQRAIEGELNLFGYAKVDEETENTFQLEHYQLRGEPVHPYRFATLHHYAGGLTIQEVNLFVRAPSEPATSQPPPILAEVQWASEQPYADSLSVSLRLLDATGNSVGQVDSELWSDLGELAPKWRTPEASRLFLELETPPLDNGPYTVLLLPYETTSLAPLAPLAETKEYQIGQFEPSIELSNP